MLINYTIYTALITFVGKYNESIAQINILSQNKSEIVDELTYLSDDRREKEKERLGLFMGDDRDRKSVV